MRIVKAALDCELDLIITHKEDDKNAVIGFFNNVLTVCGKVAKCVNSERILTHDDVEELFINAALTLDPAFNGLKKVLKLDYPIRLFGCLARDLMVREDGDYDAALKTYCEDSGVNKHNIILNLMFVHDLVEHYKDRIDYEYENEEDLV